MAEGWSRAARANTTRVEDLKQKIAEIEREILVCESNARTYEDCAVECRRYLKQE